MSMIMEPKNPIVNENDGLKRDFDYLTSDHWFLWLCFPIRTYCNMYHPSTTTGTSFEFKRSVNLNTPLEIVMEDLWSN